MEEKSFLQVIIDFFTNRIVVLFAIAGFLFSYIVLALFNIQIVNGQKYRSQARMTKSQETVIEAPRGAIYDKFGKPLAENTVAYSVKLDVTINVEDKNQSVLDLIEILDVNGEQIIDELPITKAKPYTFLFDGSEKREERWKRDMGLGEEDEEELSYSAEKCYDYLREKAFKIPDGLSEDTERKLIAIRQSLALSRWNFNQVTIARNVSERTIAMIEEQKHLFPGAIIDVEPLRVYPEGDLFSHIIGYIRSITDQQYEEYEQYGYTMQDIVGQIGIEKSMELSLRGKRGKKTIEADTIGRVVSSEITTPAVPGDRVFLTIDSDFQKECAKLLRDGLRDCLVTKLEGRVRDSISIKDFCASMVKTNKKIVEAAYNSESDSPELFRIKQAFINDVEDFNINDSEKIKEAKALAAESIEKNLISPKSVVLALFEMGMLSGTDEYVNQIKNGRKTPVSVIREKLMSDELEPSDTGCDPCSGALAVVDVKTGSTIALVTYPSYDNNEFVNNFNMEYYNELLNDEQFPLTNRATLTRKAPGSTFKMVSATAVLQEGIVTTTSRIADLFTFTKAGLPYARCNSSHGSVDVATAIEVSCNYFFYESVYRLGNSSLGQTIQGITTLGRYMSFFGLTDLSGIEIEEAMPRYASPEYKERLVKAINPNAASFETRWTDGDTIRAAIGQSDNSFAPIHMAKYIATLANGGTRYKTHLVGRVEDFSGSDIKDTAPYVESALKIDETNLNVIFRGMYNVTSGGRGTARAIFQNMPVSVAGKTGTAEEAKNRPSHTWFVGFAPYEAPEISVAVMLPFGESSPSPSAVVAREVFKEYFDSAQRWDNGVYESFITR